MKFYQQEQELPRQQVIRGYKKSDIVENIGNFLFMHNINISQFWQSNRNYATPEDISSFCQVSGLKLNVQDVINLRSDLFQDQQVISIYDFCEAIPNWKNDKNNIVGNFLKQRSEQLMQNLQTKSKTTNKKHIKTLSRPMSVNYRKTNISNKQHKIYRGNNSKKYLENYKEKNKLKQEQLAETIQRNKNQYEYCILIKMNEINEINRKNQSSITYRAYKNAEGSINVRVFDLETLKKEITLKEFESQYKVFMKSIKQNKQWQRSSFKKSNAGYSNNQNNGTFHKKNEKKEERQKQIKNMLENTVKLTEILEEQIKIFKARGIYGTQNY